MARARNIKPSFFTSEKLADNCPLGRLLFIGLWTIADHNGNLEWKERTIKIQLLPWDECDVRQLAIALDKSGLIKFYSVDGQMYVNIPGFLKHQNPHPNERQKTSDVPEFSEASRQAVDISTLTINHDKSRAVIEPSVSDRADSLIPLPDSPSLNPDSPMPESLQQSPTVCVEASPSTPRQKTSPSGKTESKGGETWAAYSNAYFSRYGVDPVRNSKTNGQICQLVDRLGKDDAPHVAAYFVHSNNGYYVSNGHSVNCLIRDAEKLRTEWATGRRVTQTAARQIDRTASNPFAQMLTAQES